MPRTSAMFDTLVPYYGSLAVSKLVLTIVRTAQIRYMRSPIRVFNGCFLHPKGRANVSFPVGTTP